MQFFALFHFGQNGATFDDQNNPPTEFNLLSVFISLTCTAIGPVGCGMCHVAQSKMYLSL
jgi:hypothetical protein